jgi:mannosyltransferase
MSDLAGRQEQAVTRTATSPAQAGGADVPPSPVAPEVVPGLAPRRRLRVWLVRLVPSLVPALLMGLISSRKMTNPVLSWDEIATVDVATRSTSQIWQLSHTIDAAVTPYYLFMHAWTAVFGISEWALRAPAWLAMAATAGLLGELGRRLLTPAAGLLGGLLFALIPNTSRYAQEARVYAITCMLFVLAALLLYRALDRPHAGNFVLYGASVALLGTSHLVALATLGGHAVIVGLHWHRTRRIRTVLAWVAATAGAALALAPLALASAGQMESQIGWIYGPITEGDLLAAPGKIVGSVGAAWLLVGLALLASWRSSRGVAELAALALMPVIVLATAAALGKPLWVPRYMLVAIPSLALLAAMGVVGLSTGVREAGGAARSSSGSGGLGRAGMARTLFVLVALTWASLPDQRALREVDSHNGGNYREAARTVAQQQQPGDVLLFEARKRDMRPGIYYYLRDDLGRPADFLLSQSAAEVGNLWPAEVEDPAARLREQRRVWFFVYGKPKNPTANRPDLAPALRSEFRVVKTWRMTSSTLVLYERVRP